jgi:hypothetical protein
MAPPCPGAQPAPQRPLLSPPPAAQALAFLAPFQRAAGLLAAQGIPRSCAGNPLAPDAPWKRQDLHRLGQEDCERLGGIFYFRILFFNVRNT